MSTPRLGSGLGLVAALFGCLASGAVARAAPPVSIPFEITGEHAFVDVVVRGQVLSFAFDSGAGGVALDAAVARRLGVEASGEGSATGAAGSTRISVASGLTLELGAEPRRLKLEGVTAGLLPLDHLSEGLGRALDGIVGQDVLRGRLVLLDHDRRVIEIHDRRTFPFASWGMPCALSRTSPIEVDAEVELLDGAFVNGPFHVDTGAGSFLVLNSTFGQRHELASRLGATYERRGRALTGVGTPDRIGRVAGVTLCGHRFPPRDTDTEARERAAPVPATLSGATAGVLAVRGSAGLLGNALLRRFNLVFDLARRRLYLKPNESWNGPIRSDASGLQFVRGAGGVTRVEQVVERSPAAAAGLAVGDALQALDGVDVAAISLAALRERLMEPDRRFRLLVTRDGVERVVLLESREFAGLGELEERPAVSPPSARP